MTDKLIAYVGLLNHSKEIFNYEGNRKPFHITAKGEAIAEPPPPVTFDFIKWQGTEHYEITGYTLAREPDAETPIVGSYDFGRGHPLRVDSKCSLEITMAPVYSKKQLKRKFRR